MTSNVAMGDRERTTVSRSGVNGGGTVKQLRQTTADREVSTPADAQMGGVKVAAPEPPSMKNKGAAAGVLKMPRYLTLGNC